MSQFKAIPNLFGRIEPVNPGILGYDKDGYLIADNSGVKLSFLENDKYYRINIISIENDKRFYYVEMIIDTISDTGRLMKSETFQNIHKLSGKHAIIKCEVKPHKIFPFLLFDRI